MVKLDQMKYQKSVIREEYIEETKENSYSLSHSDIYRSSPRKKRIMKKLLSN